MPNNEYLDLKNRIKSIFSIRVNWRQHLASNLRFKSLNGIICLNTPSLSGKTMVLTMDSGFVLFLTTLIAAIIFLTPAMCLSDSREYRLKASFIEKFVQLTEWPDEALPPDKDEPFVIAVMGKNPFGKILDIMYRNDKIKGRRVAVRYIYRTEQITGCHLLFISKSMQKYFTNILEACRKKPILTISEVEGFAQKGGHINFYVTDKDTLHFEINETKVKESGLHMHLLLIEIAKIVE